MAGDWIKVERATLGKPEVLEMAELLGIGRHAVLGKLIDVWFWFDEQTRDGNAENVTSVTLLKRINVLTETQGFGEAMVKVGWLAGTTAPNFERHNGKTAKKRALTQSRVKRFRNADVTHESLPEKRREEKKLDVCVVLGSNPTDPSTSQVPPEHPRPNGYASIARGLLTFLNERAEKAFQPTDVNVDLIVARLREGYTESQCRQVIVRKVREWRGDEIMHKFLRPATLFGREKFNQYAGELVAEKVPT